MTLKIQQHYDFHDSIKYIYIYIKTIFYDYIGIKTNIIQA